MSRLGIIFLTWRRYLQKGLVPYDITLKQLYVLRQLSKHEFLYPSDIAEELFCDRPTATVILDNLEKQGWVYREKEVGNRKYTRVLITAAGRQKFNEIQALDRQSFDPMACFTPAELEQFDHLLRKLDQHLEAIKETQD